VSFSSFVPFVIHFCIRTHGCCQPAREALKKVFASFFKKKRFLAFPTPPGNFSLACPAGYGSLYRVEPR